MVTSAASRSLGVAKTEVVYLRATRVEATVTMLAIQKSKPQGEFCHPNLLPCRINHSGAVDASQRYWKPQIDQGFVPMPTEDVPLLNLQ